MSRAMLHKVKWTLTFDPTLKKRIQQEAGKLRVYPVQLLESLVREQLNPYGFQSVRDSVTYVASIREKNPARSNRDFLADLKKWEKK